ncbi:MAG: hypothetical protein HRT86_15750 [Ilumatobacteraceae bacterium]|nr:hypothetical protein [Ilumatobacteraceae bacterium]
MGGERHFWGEESHYFDENGGRNLEKSTRKASIFQLGCSEAKKVPFSWLKQVKSAQKAASEG